MTDYSRPGFAGRFRQSRPLDPETALIWAAALRRALPAELTVTTAIDLGAGTGRFLPVIRAAWAPSRVVAIDRSEAMLAEIEAAPDVETRVADIDDESIRRCHAQAVLCSMSLHYSVEPASLCRRLARVLQPDGLLCVRTSSRESIAAHSVLRYFPTALRAERTAFPRRTEIEGWLKDAGFVVRTETVSTPSAPSYRRLVQRARQRGIPSLQLVPTGEFVFGVTRLLVWSFARALRRAPIPHDHTLLVVGVVA